MDDEEWIDVAGEEDGPGIPPLHQSQDWANESCCSSIVHSEETRNSSLTLEKQQTLTHALLWEMNLQSQSADAVLPLRLVGFPSWHSTWTTQQEHQR